ncbi:Undecaprenyl phosphate N,N'-diacetylbacillosamine 1-phosphate transferase [Tritonibacter multivorans]|uniref:Undecaprenyl phosphate N,N'-diacetylbacillosamine 1-phosphate transferase n=1 Tax=Tritonibacter multivorans TaxID=928856 RepID=A0A0P1GUC4_9RHOB|nr:sugar transferase [Tritonibacter multivorans]MDA7421985.1 sugar transferase [Tritonibacter multivorans]CUH78726.1 Undecaprenyl phosphate N,N'-diacetylbacillosamine 1-phosphate transferase [Tritonibacter multivorans]SFD68092.1 exopolysaccharide production protein ExoY [Tritonibacter multivorans]
MGFDTNVKAVNSGACTDEHGFAMPVGGVLKRVFDIAFSSFALISLSPLMIVICFLLKIVGRGPVFFVHQRIGHGEKPFGCIKFRTMVVDADKRLQDLIANDPEARAEFLRDRKLRNDPRIVPVIGTFLRSTSLDELPQFFNVLLGDMSVVGPRPVTRDEFEDYGSVKPRYASVRPGITGLWQVSGRNNMSFDERVSIDRTYIDTWSFPQDLKIILKTLKVVTKREGAY